MGLVFLGEGGSCLGLDILGLKGVVLEWGIDGEGCVEGVRVGYYDDGGKRRSVGCYGEVDLVG